MVCCYFLEDFCINIQQFDYYVFQHSFLWAMLLGVCWACSIYIIMFLIDFRKFLAIIYSNNHSSPFSLSSPSETFMMNILVCLMVPYKFLKFCCLFIHYFILGSLDLIISNDLSKQLYWLLLPVWVCCWASLLSFSIQLCCFFRSKISFRF